MIKISRYKDSYNNFSGCPVFCESPFPVFSFLVSSVPRFSFSGSLVFLLSRFQFFRLASFHVFQFPRFLVSSFSIVPFSRFPCFPISIAHIFPTWAGQSSVTKLLIFGQLTGMEQHETQRFPPEQNELYA